MRKLIALVLAACCVCSISVAQNATVKGVITDTSSQKNLYNTVISLLRSKDSVLYKFTRSKESGAFVLNNLDSGNYELFIHHKAYANYNDHIKLESNSTIDLGKVMLSLKANLLKDVVVRSQIAAIRMKGDTTEFTADSFKVRPGASVEDLLKTLPGFTIDKDGKITAQGSNIEKVLVDGEEFFGDDPTVATRNLPADAIDKVQVFDKKSDQAAFTGIDDGQSKKTVNLKMKEDKKKGYFGKVDVAGGLNDRWSNSAMFNRFRAKQKFSAYGIMSSTGTTGLDWGDRSSYGAQEDYYDDFGGYTGDNDFDNWSSSYEGQGLPKSWAGGLNYSSKFDADKQSINGSYRYNKLNTENAGKSLLLTTLQQGTLRTDGQSNSFNTKFRHSANGMYEWNIDSSTSIKISANAQSGRQDVFNNSLSEIRNQLDTLINRTTGHNSSSGESQKLNATLLLRKKFKKSGRTFSLNIDERASSSNTKGFLFADITTFDDNRIPRDSITDQQKINETKTSIFNAKAIYTEPLSKKVFLELSYGIRSSKNNSERLSFDKNGDGKYTDTNLIYSNKYRFDVLTNTAGAVFSYNGKKLTASAGSDIAFQDFKQKDMLKDTSFNRNYSNFFPRANIRYKLNGSSSFNFSYYGSTRQPSITQIQPVSDNSNPLVIYDGNPLLKQEFNHSLRAYYSAYKVLSQKGYSINASYNATNNAIVTSQFTSDSTGKTIYRYINSNGNYNINANGGYNAKLKKADMYMYLGLNFNLSQYVNFINGEKNISRNSSPGINVNIGKSKEKKYYVYYNGSFNYNFSTSSVNKSVKNNFWTQSHSFSTNVQLPWKLEINTDFTYDLRQKTDLFRTNNNVFRWNGYIGKKILKNDKGLIKFSAYDILNQNKGYSRLMVNNTVQEQNYQTLTRYFLVGFLWNFSKTPAGMSPNP